MLLSFKFGFPGCWLLVAGYWLLVTGFWILYYENWAMSTGHRAKPECWLLVRMRSYLQP